MAKNMKILITGMLRISNDQIVMRQRITQLEQQAVEHENLLQFLLELTASDLLDIDPDTL